MKQRMSMAPFENWLSPSNWFVETSSIYSIWSKSSTNWSQQYKFPSIVISTFQNHWPLITQVFDVLEHILFFWIPLNTEGIMNFHKVNNSLFIFCILQLSDFYKLWVEHTVLCSQKSQLVFCRFLWLALSSLLHQKWWYVDLRNKVKTW